MKNWTGLDYVLLACVLSGGINTASGQAYPYQDTKLTAQARAADLVSRMTLDEKIAQTMNAAPAIPRLGIPAYDYWNEGLHGIARSGYATMFPQAIGMAATWDAAMVGKMGETVGIEARAKYTDAVQQGIRERYFGLTVWSPNINIFRDPRWGRGQETYGEDPYLTSRMGVAFIEGVQGKDPAHPLAIATPKHFAVHSGPESTRHKFNALPTPHDLEDTYLPAFRATITEAHAGSIMCAYNEIDGEPACANTMLLRDTLRKDWGFQGFVTSDCGAVDDFFESYGHHYSKDAEHASAAALLAGTDTVCGNTYAALGTAVEQKLVQESAIDTAVKRLFAARFALGILDGGADKNAAADYARIGIEQDDSAQHRELALRAARESMVLLKNADGVLPLRHPGQRPDLNIAVIGPNAASLTALEGNYNAAPSHPVLPVDGIAEEFKDSAVTYAQGSPYAEQVMLPVPRSVFRHKFLEGSSTLHEKVKGVEEPEGLNADYYAAPDISGSPVVRRIDKQIDFDWDAAKPIPQVPRDAFAVRWHGTITPPVAGDYKFGLTLGDCFPCRDHEVVTVLVDGKQVSMSDVHEPGEGREAILPAFTVHFADAGPHAFEVDYAHKAGLFGGGLTLNWLPPIEALRAEAVAKAKRADVVIAFVGLSSKLEGEEMPIHVDGFAGGDRTDIQLPAVQQRLLESLAATGKPLIVVLMNGSALAVNWAQQHASAVLEAWYPGEAGGQAIAETLSGANNPGGKLPLTFYASVDQLPPFDDYAMTGRTYRYFSGKPLYAFGYGLSYTQFTYSNVHLSTVSLKAGDTLGVDATIRNTGRVAGDAVVELYLSPKARDVSPRIALKGFQRVPLAAGSSQMVHFELDARALSEVGADGTRTVQPGDYSLYVGGAQPAAGEASARFNIAGRKPLER
jgi:beta-glucosidase